MDDMIRRHADAGPAGRLRRLTLATRLLLLGERLGRALERAALVTGGFLAAALSGALPALPGWLHAALLAAAALALAWTLATGFRGFAWPRAAEARRRLELDNVLPHRPLQTLADQPAADDDLAIAVWHLHQEAAARRVAGDVRLSPPRSGLSARDRFGLRFVVPAALVAALATSWGEGGARLAAAVTPQLGTPVPEAGLDIWLTPPAYTGLAPLLWHRDRTGAAAVPAGSVVTARVTGGRDLPVMTINGTSQPFTAVDGDHHYEVHAILAGGDGLVVEQDGRLLGHWPLEVRPATPPTVTVAVAPSPAGGGVLRLAYRAADAYGIAAVSAVVRPAVPLAGDDGALTLALPLGGVDHRHVDGRMSSDLTASPWAGLPVRLSLAATATSGLTGRSAEVALVLPERVFSHPVARRLVALRKTLALRGALARPEAAQGLAALLVRPDAFGDDTLVYLALRVAAARLGLDPAPEALAEVRDLMWQAALRLEDGAGALARRDLEAAEQALLQALDGGASDEEVRRRLELLEAAMAHYLESLPQRPGEAAASGAATSTDIDAMMRSLRDLAETGDRDSARQRLGELGALLDTLRAAEARPSPAEARATELAQRLEAIARDEQALLDRTFHAANTRDAAAPPEPDPTGAADQQELRRRLAALLPDASAVGGAVARPLAEAERAMAAAAGDLGTGEIEAALADEGEAVEKLRLGRREAGRALTSRLIGAARADPLGRPAPDGGTAVRLPDRPEIQRARELLDELRRRAGESGRPRQELDYIDRLLRQF